MTKKINNLKDLEKVIIKAIEMSMSTESSSMRQEIEKQVDIATQEMVYDRYDPINYERRGKNGGLLGAEVDATKINATSNSLTYEIEQNAIGAFVGSPEFAQDLAPTINEGWGDKNRPYNQPSGHLDYLSLELGALLRPSAMTALKSDLKKLGYNVK